MSVQKNNGPIIDPALCRCCRAIKKCRILTAEYTWMGKKEIYADMVMDCYGILLSHVDDNERDSGVCATCVVRLREAIAFRQQVLQCEELFLHAKLEGPLSLGIGSDEIDESKLKKLELELKTEPKDYSSDHHSLDDRDDCVAYSDDDADDNKPLKKEEPKPSEPLRLKEDEVKSEDSLEFARESSSDSDEPIKKKMKRKAKGKEKERNGTKKKLSKAKKQKADTEGTIEISDTEISSTENSVTEISIAENSITEHSITDNSIAENSITENSVTENCITEHSITENSITENSITENTITEIKIEITRDITDEDFVVPDEFSEIMGLNNSAQGVGIEDTNVKKKRIWVRPHDTEISEYTQICKMLEENEELYYDYYNMSKDAFEELYKLLEEKIEKEYTNYRKPILARERLAVCLRYMRTGDAYTAVAKTHNIGRSSVANIVSEVVVAIWNILQPKYMPAPRNDIWAESEKGFREVFDFPNCVGSIGGKHIIIKSRRWTGSETETHDFKNYKNCTSVVLLAIADPYYNLTMINIGNYGEHSDTHIFEFSAFYRDYVEQKELLPAKPLPGKDIPVRHVLIGDESFVLKPYLMRPYPKQTRDPVQQNFNKRIQKARTIDKVFDMLTQNWKFFCRPIECRLENAINLTKAACCLHNFIQAHGNRIKTIEKPIGKKKKLKGLVSFRPLNLRACNVALATREKFVAFFKESTIQDEFRRVQSPSEVSDIVKVEHNLTVESIEESTVE